MKCCICGPVRNCEPFLDKVFSNIEKIGSIFDDYQIMVFYDDSYDNTLTKLKEYQKINPKFNFYINRTLVSKYRTHRLAYARNFCLNYIKENYNINEYPFFIMMDFDDVNCKEVEPNILKKYLIRDDWDGLSFNTKPKYYDIWGLSIYPYCFSYSHFSNKETITENYITIQKYINDKLNKLKSGELLQCISSFNGFSIYRTNKFLNTYYDGRVRTNLLPKKMLTAHSNAAKSQLTYTDYGNINSKYEDCEHRSFHILAFYNDNAKIMITRDVLFS